MTTPRYGDWALALASALMLVLSYPRFSAAYLAPLAAAPLLIAVSREPRHWRRFILGWTAGIAFWAGCCYWIQPVLETHGGMGPVASWAGFAVFGLYKGLHLGVFALAAGLLMGSATAIVAVPAVWVAIEATHGWFGFAWLPLGNAGINMSVPMRLAPFTGVYGISFIFAMAATALALVLLRRPRRELAPLLALPLLYLLPGLPAPRRGDRIAVLVQPNISETAGWTPQWVESVHRRLELLTLEGVGENLKVPPELIVWPEAPAPMYYFDDARFRDRVNQVARSSRTYLLLNAVPFTDAREPLNSAVLVSPRGAPAGRYDKINLVPFGEFVPWPFKTIVEKVSSEAGDFAPGRQQVVLRAGEHKLGAFVCYESVFPGYVRKFARDGAEVLVNISNDGWYGRSAARDQHLAIVRMRAAENRRWILRSTNNGITSTIDPAGRAVRHLPSYTTGVARTAFSYVSATTSYSRNGDWFVWLCAALAILSFALWRSPAGLSSWWRRRPSPSSAASDRRPPGEPSKDR
jgi:apolipoprotein N-acyltransferase